MFSSPRKYFITQKMDFMKFNFKNAFFFYLILIAIPMVIALFVNNEYSVENEILIKQPKAVVFSYVNSLRNQDKFSKLANFEEVYKTSI